MRIALATEFLPSSRAGEITGGVEAYAHFVGARLGEVHECTIVAKRTDGASLDTARIGSLLQRVVFAARSVVTTWRSRPDVVVGTNYVTHPVAWLAGRARRAKVVFWYPDVLIGTWRSGAFGATGWIFELLERAVLALPADRYIAITETVADKLVAQGIPRHKIVVLPCGYEADEVEAAADGAVAKPGRLAVVCRLVPYKRVDLVIEAVALLVAGGQDVTLRVVGQGAELDPLRALASELGVADRVELVGHVARHADVLRMVAESEVFVSASEIEGFGIVVAEAMGLGVPAVVSDIDVFREVTENGRGAALFRTGDAADLAAKVSTLLTDPAARAEQVRTATQVGSRYRWDEIADATIAVLEETYRS